MSALLNKAWKILAMAAIGCSFISCQLTQQEPDRFGDLAPTENRGALIIRLTSGGPAAKTLTPPISMETDNFDIYGDGPDPETDHFEHLGIREVELSESGLTPGEWTIRVDARNLDDPDDPESNGTVIGRGQTTVKISPNVVTTARIEVKPLEDSLGTLDLTVKWRRGTIANPVIQYSFRAAGSATEISLPFTKHPPGNPSSYIFTNKQPIDLDPGYYFLSLQLLDGTGLIWGTAEAVRIVAGQPTSQVWQAN